MYFTNNSDDQAKPVVRHPQYLYQTGKTLTNATFCTYAGKKMLLLSLDGVYSDKFTVHGFPDPENLGAIVKDRSGLHYHPYSGSRSCSDLVFTEAQRGEVVTLSAKLDAPPPLLVQEFVGVGVVAGPSKIDVAPYAGPSNNGFKFPSTGSVVGVTYNSESGYCGSIVYGLDGPVGIHIGFVDPSVQGRGVNLMWCPDYVDESPLRSAIGYSCVPDKFATIKPLSDPNARLRPVAKSKHKIASASALAGPVFPGEARSRKRDLTATPRGRHGKGESGHLQAGARDLRLAVTKSSFHWESSAAAGAGKAYFTRGPQPRSGSNLGGPVLAKKKLGKKEAGIVSMSPASSDYLGSTRASSGNIVANFVSTMIDPWSSSPTRLPDCTVAPTAIAKFFANRTYTIANTAATSFGPNLLFGMNNRLSMAGVGALVNSEATAFVNTTAGAVVSVGEIYDTAPGTIMTPIQWGGKSSGADYSNPYVNFTNSAGGGWGAGQGVWGDDFGSSLSSTLPYISAYRTLASAIRVRIVGLPSSQFMTPGKIYFAQVRYDLEDLPVTEQDFVVLEQLGRASHVSADAVRASGSKTIFYTPDGSEKFNMTSNFVLAPGVMPTWLNGSSPGVCIKKFPTPTSAYNAGCPILQTIVPYSTSGLITTPGVKNAVADGPDSANADSTMLLVVAYFGASDGVVLEVDYAHVIEYIPNKSSPAGVECMVQLPSSSAMDAIYSASAISAQAKPVMIQSAGDATVGSISPLTPSSESRSRVIRGVERAAVRSSGKSEDMWTDLKDIFSQGSLGKDNMGFSYNFTGQKPAKSRGY